MRGKEKIPGRGFIIAVAVCFGLAWLGLWARAGYVQLYLGEELAEQAQRQYMAAEFERGVRGRILDRSGRVLARSVRFSSVYARPAEITNAAATAAKLAPILGLGRGELAKRLSTKKSFVWLDRQIDDKVAARIKAVPLDGIHLTSEYARLYPSGHLAGQLLGFVGVDGKGLEGIESAFEDRLAGGKAKFVVQRDASGRRLYLDAHGHEVDIDGSDVTLTIDAHVQDLAENALARAVTANNGKSGTCLVVDVASGDILAWANHPFFNPNVRNRPDPAEWRNRVCLDVFEPGSTMKAFLVAAALQEGVTQADSIYFCENGSWRVGGHTVRDTHKYQWLPVNKIIRYSSNICAAKIGLDLGVERYYEYLSALGFGEPTGAPLPGEARGVLRDPGSWYEIDLAAGSFGQGIGATALQLAKAYVCLADGGVLKPLRLVRNSVPDQEPVRIFNPAVASAVLDMLVEVVEEDGTGTRARIPGLVVAGKTGTAQKASPEGGYGDEHVSSFVALIPGNRPEYLILAVVDEPGPDYYGGVVAAPVAREVAVKMLSYFGRLPEENFPGTLAADATGGAADASRYSAPVVTSAAPAVPASAPGSVPDVRGLSLRRAMEVLARGGIVPRLEGDGVLVDRQSPAPGSSLPGEGGGSLTLWLTS